jgi:hypothetical protein
MPLQFITHGDSANDLPWARDYIKQRPESNVSRILKVRKSEKGHIVYTEDFKGYAWKNSKLLSDLIGAMNSFRMYPDLSCAMFAMANKDGSISLAVDTDTRGEYVWTADEAWDEWVCEVADLAATPASADNPLLPPELLAEIRARNTVQLSSTPPSPKTQNGGASSPKKPPKDA